MKTPRTMILAVGLALGLSGGWLGSSLAHPTPPAVAPAQLRLDGPGRYRITDGSDGLVARRVPAAR